MIGCGGYSFSQHMDHIESIVDTDPLKLEPMRIDTTVDVEDVPMSWVLDHARVGGKRFSAQMGRINDKTPEVSLSPDERETYMLMAGREVETHYVGKKPCCYRTYNKTAERKTAYHQLVRGWHPTEPSFEKWMKQATIRTGKAFLQFQALCLRRRWDPEREIERSRETIENFRQLFADMHAAWEHKVEEIGPRPTFTEFCGLHEDQVLTRFERMIGAQEVGRLYLPGDKRKLPIFSTLTDLKRNLPEYNAFAAMTFSKPGLPDPELPNGRNYSATLYMAGLSYRDRVLREGRQAADAWVRGISNGHGKDVLLSLAPFAPAETLDAKVVSITESELYERYRIAIGKQLAA
jgi:hypothetical protein